MDAKSTLEFKIKIQIMNKESKNLNFFFFLANTRGNFENKLKDRE